MDLKVFMCRPRLPDLLFQNHKLRIMKKGKRLLASLIATLAVLLPLTAKGEEVPCIVVIEKDGKSVATPMSDMSRLFFGNDGFMVSDKQGGSQNYSYSNVDKIEIGKLAESGLRQLTAEAKFAVWPTIASDRINVAGSEVAGGVSMYSLTGQLVKHIIPASEEVSIDISDLPSGYYLVKAGKSTVKIIKK